ncbi:MAG: hypothetical protein OHK0038_24560 [Flammeovirgaceae bacterium]
MRKLWKNVLLAVLCLSMSACFDKEPAPEGECFEGIINGLGDGCSITISLDRPAFNSKDMGLPTYPEPPYDAYDSVLLQIPSIKLFEQYGERAFKNVVALTFPKEPNFSLKLGTKLYFKARLATEEDYKKHYSERICLECCGAGPEFGPSIWITEILEKPCSSVVLED